MWVGFCPLAIFMHMYNRPLVSILVLHAACTLVRRLTNHKKVKTCSCLSSFIYTIARGS
jgi:hypothetical protein